jgi:heme/copper-type cytochrome/quinol oxidase subunit 1
VTRLRIVVTHALVVPVALVLFLLISIVLTPFLTHRGTDVSLDDTTYVVAHFHTSVFLLVFLVVSTVVLRGNHTSNRWLWAAWVLAALHLAAAVFLPSLWMTWSSGEMYVVTNVDSMPERLLGYAYLVTAALTLVVGLVALTTGALAAIRAARLPA